KFDDETNNSSSFFRLRKRISLHCANCSSPTSPADVRRFTHKERASNYGLLKTVMEVNLALFQQDKNSPKTILLFTVRECFEELLLLK
ncbi:hypothetical protein PFDG_05298, partial [Plasmodium falciparum Dd2]